MDKDEAIKLLRTGRIAIWNEYRTSHPHWIPDLSGETIEANLARANLAGANLLGADLSKSQFFDQSSTSSYAASLVGRTILRGAKYDRHTKFPEYVDPVEAGALYITQAEQRQEDRSRLRVFISYAWANDDVVLAIDGWLRKKGLQTKLDKRDFFAGSHIRDEIMRVMKECEIILIFHSQQSADKPWPEFEREFAADLEMTAKKEGRQPPRIIYIVIDDVGLPNITEENRIAVMAKGKRFELVCEEIYYSILQLPRDSSNIDCN